MSNEVPKHDHPEILTQIENLVAHELAGAHERINDLHARFVEVERLLQHLITRAKPVVDAAAATVQAIAPGTPAAAAAGAVAGVVDKLPGSTE